MHKLFILIHLLHSSTCFERYCAHFQEDNCINTASGFVTLFRWRFSTQVIRQDKRSPLVTCVLNSHPKRVTIPDAVLIQLSSWRWAQYCSKHIKKCNKCSKIKNLCIKFVKKDFYKKGMLNKSYKNKIYKLRRIELIIALQIKHSYIILNPWGLLNSW